MGNSDLNHKMSSFNPIFPALVSPVMSTYLMLRHPYYLKTKRYNICQGREEAYLYPDLDFYNEEFVGPLIRISVTDTSRYGDWRPKVGL